jgi:calcineurin-like phosphoesterase
VANVLGQVFIDHTPISPFEAADRAVAELETLGADLVLMDVHAEATSEKQALGFHLAGRAQAVLGTHTHVPIADAFVLPGGTAYATDVGMTGCEESIIGFDREGFLELFLGERQRLPVATRGLGAVERRDSGFRPRCASSRRDRARAQGVEAVGDTAISTGGVRL